MLDCNILANRSVEYLKKKQEGGHGDIDFGKAYDEID